LLFFIDSLSGMWLELGRPLRGPRRPDHVTLHATFAPAARAMPRRGLCALTKILRWKRSASFSAQNDRTICRHLLTPRADALGRATDKLKSRSAC